MDGFARLPQTNLIKVVVSQVIHGSQQSCLTSDWGPGPYFDRDSSPIF